jgi:hypothetical protein
VNFLTSFINSLTSVNFSVIFSFVVLPSINISESFKIWKRYVVRGSIAIFFPVFNFISSMAKLECCFHSSTADLNIRSWKCRFPSAFLLIQVIS